MVLSWFMLKDKLMDVPLVQLLRVAWIAGTLPIIIASIPIPMLSWLRGTLLGFARRGKIMHSSSKVIN